MMPSKKSEKTEMVKSKNNNNKTSEASTPTVNASSQSKFVTGISIISWLVLAAISSPISQLSLSPVYGTIPAYAFHARTLPFIAIFAFMSKHIIQRYLPSALPFYAPVLALSIPLLQCFLFPLSGRLGPLYGPYLTELLTYFPLMIISMYATALQLDTLALSGNSSAVGTGPLAESLPVLAAYMAFSFLEKAARSLLAKLVESHTYLVSRVGMQLAVGALYAVLKPSLYLLAAVPALLHTFTLNPHLISEASNARLNATLTGYNFSLLDRQESVTGYVSVLRNEMEQAQLLRCDHSLLGGDWLVTPERQKAGMTKPEPVYAVFSMLEAVRLVETGQKKTDAEKSALVIGLGIGTAPSAMIEHGVQTTIVEIDPVVHDFATKYFRLPENHKAVLRNAVDFAEESVTNDTERYDYIIHDVFTGGVEPAALFTVEFLENLRFLLRDDGVIAINYVGDLSMPSTRVVFHTIASVFPHCRLFRESSSASSPQKQQQQADATDSSNPNPDPDSDPDTSTPGGADYINSVLFCKKTKTSEGEEGKTAEGKEAIRFRKPTEGDYLGSLSRKTYLMPKEELEVEFPLPVPLVEGKEPVALLRKGKTGPLDGFQMGNALSHWRIMRTVLPAGVWENW